MPEFNLAVVFLGKSQAGDVSRYREHRPLGKASRQPLIDASELGRPTRHPRRLFSCHDADEDAASVSAPCIQDTG